MRSFENVTFVIFYVFFVADLHLTKWSVNWLLTYIRNTWTFV